MHIPRLLLSFAVLSAFFVYQVDSRAAEPVELPQVKDNSSTETAETKSTVSTETEADKGDAAATNTIVESRTETQFEVRAVQENSTRLVLSDENSADEEQPDGPVEENNKQLRFFEDDPSKRILPSDFASEAFGFFRSVGGALLKIKLAILSLNLIGLVYQSFRLISIVLTRLFPCLKSKV